MTQDQHNEEWLREAANLAERLHYAAYTWGFDVAKCGATTDTTIAMNRAKEKLAALLAHLQQRPLPVREGATILDVGFKYENGVHTPTVLVGFAPSDYDARDAFARALRSPSLPVREEPTPLSDDERDLLARVEATLAREWSGLHLHKFQALREKLNAARGVPACGACPGDGTVCKSNCRLAEESPVLLGDEIVGELWRDLFKRGHATDYNDFVVIVKAVERAITNGVAPTDGGQG